jgi:tRNA/rRNA methyltransferase
MLSSLRIVLVEPAGPLNVGSVARVMKNMGLKKLVIVNPKCEIDGEEARKMAVHAADILETATQVDSIPAALVGCERAAATTSRERGTATSLLHPQECLPWLLEAPSALIFGPEDRGLSNEELKYAQQFIRIPSSEIYPSLNLAQAVAICCYELYQLAPVKQTQTPAPLPSQAAPLEQMEGYYQHLETVLLKIGYLHPHTAASRMEKFRILLNRAMPKETEIAMLRGILRQVEWAIKKTTEEDTPASNQQHKQDS